MNISPKITSKIIDFLKNSAYELRCCNCLTGSSIHSTHFGSSPLQILPQKYVMKFLTNERSKVSRSF